ncbi:hypothetical protein GJAV_G00022340 [Gymnothorax javanicus]|nr:hypothetical protein GJAV_G00022340 [Gymnothorax javanicus]
MWVITPEERDKYDKQFATLIPAQGYVSRDQAHKFFLLSGLPAPVLARIWRLADLNKDGKMDRQEFAIAMKLIKLKLQGEILPAVLPHAMTQSNTAPQTEPSLALASRLPPAASNHLSALPPGIIGPGITNPPSVLGVGPNSSSSSSPSNAPNAGVACVAGVADWAVPEEYQLKYLQLFSSLDRQTGFLSGPQVRSILAKSNLTQVQLATIWNLADLDKNGKLSAEEFILAMHLVDMVKMGLPLPLTLPEKLIPPSHRAKRSSDVANGITPSRFSEAGRNEGLQKAVGNAVAEEGVHLRKLQEEKERREKAAREEEDLRRRQLEQERRMVRQREMEREKQQELKRKKQQEEAMKLELERLKKLELEQKKRQELEQIKRLELEGQRDRERQDITQLKTERNSLEQELEALVTKHKQIFEDLQDVQKKKIVQKTEVDMINKNRNILVKDINSLEQQCEEFQKKLNQLVTEHKKLSDIQRNSDSCNLSSSTVTMMKTSVSEKDAACSKLKEQLEALEKDMNSKLAEMDENASVIKKLKENQKKQQSALDKLAAIRDEKLREIEAQKAQQLEKKKREEEEAIRQAQLEEERRRHLEEQREAALREEERQREMEHQRKEEEQRRLEQMQREAEERKKEEAERRRLEELQREEAERQRQEELKRVEAERQRQEELQRVEADRQRQEELQRVEAERQRMEKVKREEEERERQREQELLDAKVKREEEELLQVENERRHRAAEEERKREQQRLANELKMRQEEQKLRAADVLELHEGGKVTDEVTSPLETKDWRHEDRGEPESPKLKDVGFGRHSQPPSLSKAAIKGKVAALLKGLEDRKGAKRENSKGLKKGAALAVYKALYPYSARRPEELRFEAGDLIEVDEAKEKEKGWLYGHLRGSEGWFPVSYVEKQINSLASPVEILQQPSQILPSNSSYIKPEHEVSVPETVQNVPAETEGPSALTPGSAPTETVQSGPGHHLQALALRSWAGGSESDLSFSKDMVITVLQQQEDWWLGEVNGTQGWFPKAFVTPLSPDGEPTGQPNHSVDGNEGFEEYVALYTYESLEPGDLTFTEGSTILVLEKGGDWWKGRIGDRTGVFPSNYVKPKEVDGGHKEQENGTRSSLAPVQSCQVLAKYDYRAETQDELSFSSGHLIKVLEKIDADWWKGEINGITGLFPTNYVEITTKTDASEQPSPDLSAMGPLEKKRQDCIQELLETEERHLEDLQLAKEIFYKLMSESGRLTEQELNTIFLNWSDLITCSKKLIKALQERKRPSGKNVPVQIIGDVVTSELSDMQAYVLFCTSQLKGAAFLQQKTDQEPEFKDFLKKIATDYRCKGNSLSSFLIKPMQRITRYRLIIKNILECTPETHADHVHLQRALETAEKLCSQVNEGVRQKENEDRLEWLQSHVQCDGVIENLVFNSLTNCLGPRKLLHSGKVHCKSKGNKELFVFLFNDFLLFTYASKFSLLGSDKLFNPKSNMQFKVYKKPVFLNELIIKIPPDQSAEEPIFHVSHINRVYVLKTESVNERTTWVQKITAASDEFMNVEKMKREKTYQGRSQTGSEIGRLLVTILEAMDLRPCKPNGKCNPYCEVTMAEQCYTSRTLNDTLVPKWNFNCQFFLKDLNKDTFCITIREKDQFSPDGFLGRTEVLLATVERELENKGPVNRRLLLQGVETGEVWVQLDLQMFQKK